MVGTVDVPAEDDALSRQVDELVMQLQPHPRAEAHRSAVSSTASPSNVVALSSLIARAFFFLSIFFFLQSVAQSSSFCRRWRNAVSASMLLLFSCKGLCPAFHALLVLNLSLHCPPSLAVNLSSLLPQVFRHVSKLIAHVTTESTMDDKVNTDLMSSQWHITSEKERGKHG